MKRIISYMLIAGALFLTACASESTAEQAAASCGNVAPTTTDQDVSSSCRISSSEERVDLTGVSFGANGDILRYDFLKGSSDGLRVEFERTTATQMTMRIYNLKHSTTNNCRVTGITIDAKICVEHHIGEDPMHIIAWKGDGDCNSSSPDEANAIFNSEAGGPPSQPTCDNTNVLDGVNKPAGTGFTFRKTGTGTFTKISSAAPKFSG